MLVVGLRLIEFGVSTIITVVGLVVEETVVLGMAEGEGLSGIALSNIYIGSLQFEEYIVYLLLTVKL